MGRYLRKHREEKEGLYLEGRERLTYIQRDLEIERERDGGEGGRGEGWSPGGMEGLRRRERAEATTDRERERERGDRGEGEGEIGERDKHI